MQTALVVLIVAAAAVYVLRVFYKNFKQKQDCNCTCSSCQIADSCSEPKKDHSSEISADPSNSSVR